ncbi:MAG TPA: glycosyltransferase [Solirubrobacter sp.]|nr:glycosyltransferase [Solirubrobacter sp.]
MPLSIDVAVAVFNRYDLTERCLAQLREQTREHRAIVCDDGSTDGTAERLQRDWPEARVVAHQANRGFARATNAAAAAGDGDVVVLLNNDVDFGPEFLERLVAPLERDAGLGSVAAVCLRPGGRTIDSVGLTADRTLSPFARLQSRPAGDAARTSPVLAGPSGTAAAYRREAWNTLDGLDERIFAYGEDFDLALRLRTAGWGTVAATDATCVHLGSATFGHRSGWQRRQGGFSRAYIVRRYGWLRTPAAARTAFTEALVVAGDAVLSRDLAALRGRVAGWRGAAGLPRRPRPPADALDHGITLREALALRRGAYASATGAR